MLLRTRLGGNIPLILGDRVHLQQVVLNLLINAIEAMSGMAAARREIFVSSQKVGAESGASEETVTGHDLAAESSHVLIAVRDSGPGLDATALEHLFDAFYTTKAQGLGVGLAISRSIIEAHGGKLWASANTPRGAVFQLTLPIRG